MARGPPPGMPPPAGPMGMVPGYTPGAPPPPHAMGLPPHGGMMQVIVIIMVIYCYGY